MDSEVRNINSLSDSERTAYVQRIQELEEENKALKSKCSEWVDRYAELIQRMLTIDNSQQPVIEIKPPAWKKINIAKIVDLYRKGKSMNEIARTLGINPHTVKSRLIEVGLLKSN